MAREQFTAVTFKGVYPQHAVAEHEVLMAFNGDSDAVAFREWWDAEGAEVFAVWLRRERSHDRPPGCQRP